MTQLVKSKSMLTEECHLNPYLEARGIEVTDTDLGERIVQLRREPPSHIVLPAIHLKKEDIGELFHAELGTEKGASDPKYLTEAARQAPPQALPRGAGRAHRGELRGRRDRRGGRLHQRGQRRHGHLAAAHPHRVHGGGEARPAARATSPCSLRLLARSATGQAVTTYTTHLHGPRPGGELHIVVVDNGRSSAARQRQPFAGRSPASAAAPASIPARSSAGAAGTATAGPSPAPSAPSSHRRAMRARTARSPSPPASAAPAPTSAR